MLQPLASSLSQSAEEASALNGCGLAAARCDGSSGGRAVATVIALSAELDRNALIRPLKRATLTQVRLRLGAGVSLSLYPPVCMWVCV